MQSTKLGRLGFSLLRDIFVLTIIVCFGTVSSSAQVSKLIKYQGLVKENGVAIASSNIDIDIDIVQTGSSIYAENHNVNTSPQGIFNINIGAGQNAIGIYSDIDWSLNDLSIQVMINGNLFETVRFSAVPYALYSYELDQKGATVGQVLKWNGENWVPDEDLSGNGADDWGTQSVVTDNQTLNGDGTIGNELEVRDGSITADKISNGAIDADKLDQMGASSGEVLKWDGSSWIPSTDIGGGVGDDWGVQTVVTDNTTINGNGTTMSPIEIIDESINSQKITNQSIRSIDLADDAITSNKIEDGTIIADDISSMGAATNQVLKWNGISWEPQNDETGSGGSADNWGTQFVQTDGQTIEGTGVLGDELSITDGSIDGSKLSDFGADAGQVLKWNGSTWQAQDDATGSGTGTGDDWGSQAVITENIIIQGDGTTANPLGIQPESITGSQIQDGSISGADIDATGAASGQVLKFNGTQWAPANDEGGAGVGDNWGTQAVEADGSTIGGTGVLGDELELLNNSVDGFKIIDESIGEKDLGENSVNSSEIGDGSIAAVDLSSMGAAPGQVLKWNGTTWEAQNDNTGGGGSGDDWGTQTVEIDNDYLEGDGTMASPLSVLDESINSDKIMDNSIGGNDINDMSATNGQVLKWNGAQWAPANDDGGSGGSGDNWGSQTVVADDVYISGTGILGDEITIVDGSIDNAKLGDDAVYSLNIQDGAISNVDLGDMGAAAGEVLKYDGTNWVPSVDESGSVAIVTDNSTIVGDGTIGDELRVGVGGITTVEILDETITQDDILDGSIGSSELLDGGVTAIDLNNMGAAVGQVLKYNGTQWAPGPDEFGAGIGDNWGTQFVEVDNATITGTGIPGDELSLLNFSVTNNKLFGNAVTTDKISNQTILGEDISDMGASLDDVLTFNGTTWTPRAFTSGSSVWTPNNNGLDSWVETTNESIRVISPLTSMNPETVILDPINGMRFENYIADGTMNYGPWQISAEVSFASQSMNLGLSNIGFLNGDDSAFLQSSSLTFSVDDRYSFFAPSSLAFELNDFSKSGEMDCDSIGFFQESGFGIKTNSRLTSGDLYFQSDIGPSNGFYSANGFSLNFQDIGSSVSAGFIGFSSTFANPGERLTIQFQNTSAAENASIYYDEDALNVETQNENDVILEANAFGANSDDMPDFIIDASTAKVGVGIEPTTLYFGNFVVEQRSERNTFGGIGLIGPINDGELELYYNDSGTEYFEINKSGSTWARVNSAGMWTTSDKNLKKNIAELDSTIPFIKSIGLYSYNMKNSGQKSIGPIAQEIEKYYPELVTTTSRDSASVRKLVNYNGLVAVSMKAIQEQQEIIEEQSNKLEKNEAEIADLKNQIQSILKRLDAIEK